MARRARASRDRNTAPAGAPASPWIQRSLPFFDVLDEEKLVRLEAQVDWIFEEVGIAFRDDPEALRDLERGGRQDRRRHDPRRCAVDPRPVRQGAARVHPAGPQPGAVGHHRRHQSGVRSDLRRAVCARPGRRAALWRHGELREAGEAHLHASEPASRRVRDLRALRCAGLQAPFRHALCPYDAERQTASGRHHRDEPGAGQCGHGRDRLWQGCHGQ